MLKLKLQYFGHLMWTANYWESPWSWERLRAEGEEGIRGWDGWMASLIQWTWIWANFGKGWGTGRTGMLLSMGLPRVGHDWETELNWTDSDLCEVILHCSFDLRFSNHEQCWTSFHVFVGLVLLLLPSVGFMGFPCGSAGKKSTCNMGDLSSIPGLHIFFFSSTQDIFLFPLRFLLWLNGCSKMCW